MPLLREGETIGVFALMRDEVSPFTDKQIELVATFADQAVIAIENVRLFEDVQARTQELSESLRQQTATAEVLKTISRTAFDLQRVLETLLENAVRICGANHGMIYRYDGECCRAAAAYNAPSGSLELWERTPIRAGRGTTTARVLLERRPVQIPDVLADPEYDFPEAQKLMGIRTTLAVPLLREGVPLGTITLWKTEVAPFTDKQIELLTTFADQAVIAIENVRLFDEIQDKSRQLAEASQHKSQFLANMSHELRTPLNAIIGVTEMLREDAEALKQDLEPLDRVLGAARHLLALINDILDLSKIEAGRMELQLEDFALAPLIDNVVRTIEPLAAKNENRVVVSCDAAIGSLHADPMRLRQALLNLMSNANKFTERGTNGPVMADRTLALIRKIMNWHASRSDEFRSPIVRGMSRSKARARERILTDDELRKLWRADGVFGALVRFILLTAARRSEASEMTWPELVGSDWTLPASRNKTKVDLVRPLSKAALAALPRKVDRCDYVFSTNGLTPIGAFSRLKARLSETSGVTDWSLHDLRRTSRSLMSRAGVPTDHAERCLGHVIGGVRGVYDRHEYLEEKRRAFEALAAQVQRIIDPQPNVVAIGRQR